MVCGNHTGPLDALAYGHLLQASGIAPRFLAKEAMFRVPVLGTLLRATGQVPVHRGSRRGQDALASGREALARGEMMMVFPEGSYTRDPEVWPMRGRLGAARLALSTGAPLVPVACWGSRALWPVGTALPRPGRGRRIVMSVGEPIRAERREGESEHAAAVRVTGEVMAAIAAQLGALRGQTPPTTLHDPASDALRPESGQKLSREDLHCLRDAAAAALVRAQTALPETANAQDGTEPGGTEPGGTEPGGIGRHRTTEETG